MTKQQLESYQSNIAEIAELQYRLKHINEGGAMIGHDTILDYRKGYPIPRAVIGVNPDRYQKKEKKYKQKIDALTKECEEIEDFIEEIPDSLTRRIFRMYYVEGQSQKDISQIIHIDRSCISRKITDYFKKNG